MGIWIINGQALELNLVQPLADRWHQEGLRFCWMKDNPTILDVNNDEYYTSSEDVVEEEEKEVNASLPPPLPPQPPSSPPSAECIPGRVTGATLGTTTSDSSETHRVLKEVVNVLDSCKKKITGHIIHWVKGPGSATPHRDWFIIRPK